MENEGGRVGDLNLHYVDLKARMSVERKKNLSLQPVCRYGGERSEQQYRLFPLAISFFGELAEWSIAAVLKTVEVRASGGSNPSLSAPKQLVAQQQAAFFIASSENLFSGGGDKKRGCIKIGI